MAAALVITESPAKADTVVCSGAVITLVREFSLTTTPTASCLGGDAGNVNGKGDAINALGFLTIDRSDNTLAFVGVDGELTITGKREMEGSFSFTAPAGYFNFVLAIKSGERELNPDWVAFLLPDGVTSGTWAILDGIQPMQHGNLYAMCIGGICPDSGSPPAETPLPGAIWLMGSMLAGASGVGAWRRRRSRPAA